MLKVTIRREQNRRAFSVLPYLYNAASLSSVCVREGGPQITEMQNEVSPPNQPPLPSSLLRETAPSTEKRKRVHFGAIIPSRKAREMVFPNRPTDRLFFRIASGCTDLHKEISARESPLYLQQFTTRVSTKYVACCVL